MEQSLQFCYIYVTPLKQQKLVEIIAETFIYVKLYKILQKVFSRF